MLDTIVIVAIFALYLCLPLVSYTPHMSTQNGSYAIIYTTTRTQILSDDGLQNVDIIKLDNTLYTIRAGRVLQPEGSIAVKNYTIEANGTTTVCNSFGLCTVPRDFYSAKIEIGNSTFTYTDKHVYPVYFLVVYSIFLLIIASIIVGYFISGGENNNQYSS